MLYLISDTEIKKHICTTIRSFALVHNASILFYSLKEPQLARRAKELFHDIGFGSRIALKEKNINYNKPLMIAKGTDTWDSIGLPLSTVEQVLYTYTIPMIRYNCHFCILTNQSLTNKLKYQRNFTCLSMNINL